MNRWIVLAAALSGPAMAQAPTGVSQAGIDEAVRRGTIATLANVCGLREEAWAFDLRRATIMDAAHASRPDDEALSKAPGSPLVTTAMTYAETEALEDFAEAPATVTCERLKTNPDLSRADTIVQNFRELKKAFKPAS